MDNQFKNQIIMAIQKLGLTYSVWDVFSDFVELGALSVANSTRRKGDGVWEKQERRYLNIIGKYKPDEQETLVKAFADLVMALELEAERDGPSDVLGPIYHALELHNKYKGQFFTPQSVCDMMSEIVSGNVEEAIKENGFISLCEPCVGSGAMILGFAKSMLKKHLNYSTQLVVDATDVDLKCVYMTYLQLSLYGIPAVVRHGNSLTNEQWAWLYTPMYLIGMWPELLEQRCSNNKSRGVDEPSKCDLQLTSEDLERSEPK